MKTRTFLFLMLLGALTLALSACGDEGSDAVARPVVRLQVNDQTYEENVYSYCWPESADDLVCDMDAVALVQPIRNVPVSAGDSVQFVLDSDAGTPARFTATLLGFDDVRDLGTDSVAEYPIALEDNLYRVRVDAEYDNVEGQPAYVSYVFGLAVAVVVVPTPTPTLPPTQTPLPTPTPAPTLTPQPTATPAPPPTETPLPEPTEAEMALKEAQPTEVAAEGETAPTAATVSEGETAQPTEATPLPETAEPTLTPAATPQPVATGDLGALLLVGTVRVTDTGTTLPVVGATVRYEHESSAWPERASAGSTLTGLQGQFNIGPLILHDTDTITVSAFAPGYEIQTHELTGLEVWQAGGVIEFVLVPVPAAREGDAAAQPVVPSTSAAGSVPPLALVVAGRLYVPVGLQYCQQPAGGEQTCTELPAPEGSTERLGLLRGSAAQLRIGGGRPTSVRIEYLTDTGIPTGQPENRPGDNVVLFIITPEPGSYIMAVRVTWTGYEATYFFRVSVSD